MAHQTDQLTVLTLASSGSPLFLVSFWKPVIILLVFVPWAWVITKVYDKHAARFFLPRRQWNLGHLIAGTLALGVLLAMPIRGELSFWIGLLAMIAILAADLVIYAVVANKDERVPERFHIKLNMASLGDSKASKAAAKAQAKVQLVVRSPDEKGKFTRTVPAPQPETPEFEVRVASEEVYTKAMLARAAQIDIGPTGKEGVYGVALLVDGVRQALEGGGTMPAAQAVKIMDFWKAAAGLDVSDRRRRLQGNVQIELAGGKKVVRVTSLGVQGGMRVSMLIDPEGSVLRKPTDLGLLEVQQAELKAIAEEAKGVVLVGTPPDGGRTTIGYSLLQLHDAYTMNVQTLESDAQASLEGVRVNKFEPEKEGAEFSTLVRSVLRRDPQVVLVAEVPDAATAKEINKADLERTRVYVGVKADSASAAIESWLKSVGEVKTGANALHGVIVGKLIRKLCPNCKAAYPPPADMLKKLGLPADKVKQLFKKGGQVLVKNKPEICPMCQGGGYFGQEGIFEVFAIGPDERAMVAAGDLNGLRAAMRKKQQPTIQQAAIRKAIDGVTSVEEVMRVTAPAASPAAPAVAAAKPAGGAA
ncbi:MAG: Flp pilus assembly complex ATPase component TadA [Phycisphaeraceae bacterium]|nr:Flp pilus assembly complex ATPase component TadA [Phycisphaeraceae bacterium]